MRGGREDGKFRGKVRRGKVRLTAPQAEQVLEDSAVAAPHLGQAEVWALVRGCMFAGQVVVYV